MLIRLKRVVYFKGYKLKITFSDGKVKIVDFEEWIFESPNSPYLELLKDLEYFKQFSMDDTGYTVCWPTGADFCPDVLYSSVGIEQRKAKKRKLSVKKQDRLRRQDRSLRSRQEKRGAKGQRGTCR